MAQYTQPNKIRNLKAKSELTELTILLEGQIILYAWYLLAVSFLEPHILEPSTKNKMQNDIMQIIIYSHHDCREAAQIKSSRD